jgi:hypothetical protein
MEMVWEEELGPALASVIGEAAKYDVRPAREARVRRGSNFGRLRGVQGQGEKSEGFRCERKDAG